MPTCFLRDLKVKKVSFVTRGANRRQFFLAKSADAAGDADINNPQHNSGGTTIVRPEIKAKVGEILKAERNIDKICALLKEDAVLKATDAEISEIKDFLALVPPPPPVDNTAAQAAAKAAEDLKKAQEDAKTAAAEKKALEDRLNKIEEDQHKGEVKKWVEGECPYLNIDTNDAVTQILSAEKVSKEVADSLRKSFKSTSDVLKNSLVMKEFGRDGEMSDPLCGNLVGEVVRKTNELKKTSSAKGTEIVIDAIRSVGSDRYERYRKDFNQRARTA